MNIQSKPNLVTVFKDRALVSRQIELELKSGAHQLIIEDIPTDIDPDSIQVNGSANGTLQDVKLKRVYIKPSTDNEIKSLKKEKRKLEEQIESLDDQITNLAAQKEFLQNMSNTAAESNKKSIFINISPKELIEKLDYYRKSLDLTDKQIRELSKEKTDFDKQLNLISKKLKAYNNQDYKEVHQLELKLLVETSGKIGLQVSYLIFNASWKPVYDLRASSTNKKMHVAYNAVVSQNTGEKWDDVQLKLSTAQAHLSATKPELSAWFIDIYQEPVYNDYEDEIVLSKSKRKMSKKASPLMQADMMLSAKEMAPPMPKPVAQIETGATSVVFAIPGRNSIADNGDEHKVGISAFEFEADFRYHSVPKLSPFAFLTAIVKNESEFPLLTGKSNVFLDNNFVTNSNLPLVAPNEEFKTSLGIDEGIKIEHKLINKFHKDEGLFSKKEKISFEYKITVKNNKATEENIIIEDHIPISQNNDLKVELVDPKYKEDTDLLKMSESKFLKWDIKLDAGEEYIIPLKFNVEYPRDESLTGL